jgi:hypothetical protein
VPADGAPSGQEAPQPQPTTASPSVSAAAPNWGEMSSLESALALAERDVHVFPVDHPELAQCAGVGKDHDRATCDQRGKHPAVAWSQQATTNPKLITTWFTGLPRNVGVHCGKSNLVVIDEDRLDAFQQYAAEHGAAIPPTFVVTTGKGRHFYFTAPEGRQLGNEAGALKPYGIDVRAGNGYVVGPGSRHATGVAYTVEMPLPPAPLPDWVIDAIAAKAATNGQPYGEYTQPGPAGQTGFELPTVIRYGDRDETLFKYAASLRARSMPYAEAETRMRAAWERCEQPPIAPDTYDLEQALGKLRGAYDRYADGPSADYRLPPVTVLEDPSPTSPAAALSDLILPAEFYVRDVLREIREYAHSRGAAADPVLYATLARISGMVPHQCRLDTGIGSVRGASLNLFVIPVGPSGSGKSSSADVSKDIYPGSMFLDFGDGLPLGSGEGIAEAFMGWVEVETGEFLKNGEPKKKKVRCQVRHNAFFVADEGEALTKTIERSGSTIGPTIRTAWYGGALGQQNAEADRRRLVPDGSYSMGMLIGFQPETVLPLLRDAAAGTPARFVYCSTIDPTRPLGPLGQAVAPKQFAVRPAKMSLQPSVAEEVQRHHHAYGTGAITVPRLDAHAYLTRLKLAALLALLEGRYVVSEDDWRLAGIMWEVSCKVRDHYLAQGVAADARERHIRNAHYADREGMAEVARQRIRDASAKVVQVARLIGKYVHDPAKPARTVGDVNRRLESVNRPYLAEALDYAASEGWIERDDNQVAPGPSRPA